MHEALLNQNLLDLHVALVLFLEFPALLNLQVAQTNHIVELGKV